MTDAILGYLAGEIYVISDWVSWVVTLFLFGFFFVTARFAYRNFGLEYLNLDGIYKPFESEFYKTFAFYCLWALAQQILLTFVLAFTGMSGFAAFVFCLFFFSVGYHMGNARLMLATALFGLFVYPFYTITCNISVVQIALLHAFMGTSYKLLGWDMRVYRFK